MGSYELRTPLLRSTRLVRVFNISIRKMVIRKNEILNLFPNTGTPAACGSYSPTAACEHQSDNYVPSSAMGGVFLGFSSPVIKNADMFLVLCDTNLITFLPNFIIRDNIP